MSGLGPLRLERSELGYNLQLIREGRTLRVIHRPCESSNVCLFFVHGAGGRGGQFKHIIKALENSVNIVAFDFLGHGESPHINNCSLYTADEHLQDLVAIFDKYKKDKNVYVCHSYGNIHVLRHLKMLTVQGGLEQIAGVVMIGLGVNAPVSLGLAGKLPCIVLEWLRPFARSASNAALFSSSTDPELIRSENSISDSNRMYTMRTIGLDCSSQATWDRWLQDGRQALVGSDVPRVLISGDQDGVFDLDSSKTLKQHFEIANEHYHVVEGVGHIPMLERGKEVSQIVVNFLCQSLMCLVRRESLEGDS